MKDLREAALYSHATRIVAGDFTDCANADVIMVTVDAPQHRYKGSRLDDLKISAAMVKEVMTARLGFLALQGKGIECSRSTHTKKTANASELKTTMIRRPHALAKLEDPAPQYGV